MPYYGDHLAGDPGLFGKIFRGIGKVAGFGIRAGIRGLGVTPFGGAVRQVLSIATRPASPAPGVVTRAREIRAATPSITRQEALRVAGVAQRISRVRRRQRAPTAAQLRIRASAGYRRRIRRRAAVRF